MTMMVTMNDLKERIETLEEIVYFLSMSGSVGRVKEKQVNLLREVVHQNKRSIETDKTSSVQRS